MNFFRTCLSLYVSTACFGVKEISQEIVTKQIIQLKKGMKIINYNSVLLTFVSVWKLEKCQLCKLIAIFRIDYINKLIGID